jgi:hypothetical protein
MSETSYAMASQALLRRLIDRSNLESPEGIKAICEALSILEQARIYADASIPHSVAFASDSTVN